MHYFLKEVAQHIEKESDNHSSLQYLIQQISVVIQKGSAVCFRQFGMTVVVVVVATSAKEVMFYFLLSVCLFVSRITQKVIDRFS